MDDEYDFDEDDPPRKPERRAGTFSVFDFEAPFDDLPSLLERIASWIRFCAEYSVEQINLTTTTDDGWVTIAVTVLEIRAGDVMQQLTAVGLEEMATAIASLVRQYGLREGLRKAGLAHH